ncbi:MAG: hypothetical protein IPK17_35990 [Chloroflexi bacterium]|uniref:hypothetical protein n=1 Tax=Candidatus Flexifilum breve TaxID=3140694 RepID=UPI003135EDF2|nr:hypothetical protein [Chloroflexota bacterium]
MTKRPNRPNRPGRAAPPTGTVPEVGRSAAELPGGGLPDIDVPDINPLVLYSLLSADVPLLLLPVRLETRFYRDPNRLKIRVYPDQIHVNSHQPELSAREVELGQHFWQLTWTANWQRASRIFKKLADTLGVWRAVWVMESTTPTNMAALGTDKPLFPPINAARAFDAPAHFDLLPARWVAVGRLNGATVFTEVGEPIPSELRFAPFQLQNPDDLDHWLADFEAAQRVGMAFEIALTGDRSAIIDQGLDELIVLGIRVEDPQAAANALENTLLAHYYTRGFDFVPQGTPTNNTETVRSPWAWNSADPQSVLQRLWQPTPAADDSYRQRFAAALGLKPDGLAARALHGDVNDLAGMESMNHTLWYSMWGEYLRFMFDDGTQTPLSAASIDDLRDWFIDHVRGGAVYPAFHVGSMPYGLLPIQLQPSPRDANTQEEYLQWVLEGLRAGWERSLPNVPHLDPTATALATDVPITTDLETANDHLIAILSSHPHPTKFFTRRLDNLRTWSFWSLFFDPVDLYEGQKDVLLERTAEVDSVWSSAIESDLRTPFLSLADQQDYYGDLLADAESRYEAAAQAVIDFGATFGGIIPPAFVDELNALVATRDQHELIVQIINNIVVLLTAHANRVYPVTSLNLLPLMDALSAETPNPEHFYFVFDQESSAWGDLPLVQAEDALAVAPASVYLAWLSDYAHGTASGTQPAGLPDPAPLLYQLIKRSIDRANAWDNDQLVVFDQFVGSINQLDLFTVKAERVNTIKQLATNTKLLDTTASFLTTTLQSPTQDPTRVTLARVPRRVFATASTYLTEYKQVTRRATPELDSTITVLDQWAAIAVDTTDSPIGWGGTHYLPPKAGVRVTQLANAIAELAALPPADLEIRLQETLGLAMHRLDAWITAYAEDSIDAKRVKYPTGVQIGGFGWVENLRPDQAGTSASQGFIHAPSMTQAAAAAVLRSGYSAFSDGTATSPMSVDLRSDRVRIARWMMDGVRQGQPVNELLGYRFERYLHDEFLDIWIEPVRAVVAEHGTTEYSGSRRTAVVDGLGLLELWNEGSGTLATLITAPTDSSGVTHQFSELQPALEHLVWITDSMADLALAESVHALVQGDYERASAVQNASALGDIAPPEVRSVLTPNSGMTITHRLMLIPSGTDSPWKHADLSQRSALEPALEEWVSGIVGEPGRILYQVRGTVDPTVEIHSLAELPLSALDAVYLAPVDSQIVGSGLGKLIALEYLQRHVTETNIVINAYVPAGAGEITLADFILLANTLRSVLSAGRAATVSDFSLGESSEAPAATVAEFQRRARDLAEDFASAVRDLADPLVQPFEALLRLSYFNLPQAIPTSRDAATLAAQAGTVLTAVETRRDEIRVKYDALTTDQATATPDAKIRAVRELIALVLGRDFPVMTRIQVPISAAKLQDQPAASGAAHGVMGWLLKMARVRPDLLGVRELITAAEAIRDRALFDFAVAQLPQVEGDSWVGISRPNQDGGDRLSLVLTSNADLSTLSGLISGLVLDQWVERIPSSYEMTGLTFHFDAPTSRPPQSLLLAVPPSGQDWDFSLVVDTVREAFARARLRAVAPETLGEYGHQLPAVYLTGNLDMIGAVTDD